MDRRPLDRVRRVCAHRGLLRHRAGAQSRGQLRAVQQRCRDQGIVFSLLAAVIVAILLVWLWRAPGTLLPAAIGLVVGGAIGNVIDRLRLGSVVDFLDFHLGGWHWPAFNLADAAICIGVGLMIIDGLLGRRGASN